MTRMKILIGTRKGAFILKGKKVDGPHFLGQIVNHVAEDPRKPGALVAAVKTGHLGPTVYRSENGGRTWEEAKQPPKFSKESGDAVQHVFWISAGHASRPGEWYAGTAPQGIFRSQDGGKTWEGLAGFNENPMRPKWRGLPENQPPDAPNTHSINVDPRDADHLYVGLSGGGFFESRDGGKSWTPMNAGVEVQLPPGIEGGEFAQDPHCVRLHPKRPDRLWMQNHFGLYRLDRPGTTWERVGKNLPKEVGDIGFPIGIHPTDPDVAWVFPMDGTEVWPRTCPGGKPAVYRTRDAGKSWKRLDRGMPRKECWWTVKRQALTVDPKADVWFGTMSGAVWRGRDEGERWECAVEHLPAVCSIEPGS
jgi:photosystem II stability/assembly factor-like uncharacterized protein